MFANACGLAKSPSRIASPEPRCGAPYADRTFPVLSIPRVAGRCWRIPKLVTGAIEALMNWYQRHFRSRQNHCFEFKEGDQCQLSG